jgi:inosine/xanthosine triphosphatase
MDSQAKWLVSTFVAGMGLLRYARGAAAAPTSTSAPIVVVGTKNKCKLAAVRASLARYPGLAGSAVEGLSVDTGVDEQPRSLEETSQGAMNRARLSHAQAAAGGVAGGMKRMGGAAVVSFGIESGLFELRGAWYDVCFCAVTSDGETFNLGLSCAFEIPPAIMAHVHEGLDLTQACNAAKITEDETLGMNEGLIGILSKGRITRQDYTEQAVMTALMHYENKPWY